MSEPEVPSSAFTAASPNYASADEVRALWRIAEAHGKSIEAINKTNEAQAGINESHQLHLRALGRELLALWFLVLVVIASGVYQAVR